MQVVHEVCCGLDIHKESVTACVLWASSRRRQTREFGTFTRQLLELGDWLRACEVETYKARREWNLPVMQPHKNDSHFSTDLPLLARPRRL